MHHRHIVTEMRRKYSHSLFAVRMRAVSSQGCQAAYVKIMSLWTLTVVCQQLIQLAQVISVYWLLMVHRSSGQVWVNHVCLHQLHSEEMTESCRLVDGGWLWKQASMVWIKSRWRSVNSWLSDETAGCHVHSRLIKTAVTQSCGRIQQTSVETNRRNWHN